LKTCDVEQCSIPYYGKGYCQKHYDQVRRGVPLGKVSQKAHRPAIIVDDVAHIPLGVEARKGYALVDLEFAYLDRYNWSLDGHGYPLAYVDGKFFKLHHMVTGEPSEGLVVDHINRNKLDARCANLRLTSQNMNMHNMSMPNTNTSGVIGVTWNKARSKWQAQIRISGLHRNLGCFNTIAEAAEVRRNAELLREQLYSKIKQ
jgi:hypothetical protein